MLCIHLGTIHLGWLYQVCSGTLLFTTFAFADFFGGNYSLHKKGLCKFWLWCVEMLYVLLLLVAKILFITEFNLGFRVVL